MSAESSRWDALVETPRKRLTVAVVLAVVLIGGPVVINQVFGQYWISLLITTLIFALFAMGFNLLFGYTGLLSFGHAAFFGTAGYTMAFVFSGGVEFLPSALESFVPALLLAVLASVIVAMIIGAFCVQRGAIYFAMLTLAFAMLLYELSEEWRWLTGGDDGYIVGAGEIDLLVVSFRTTNALGYYFVTLALVSVSIFALWRIVRSPYGEILVAIRENPGRAEHVGIRVKRYQWTAFVLSGLFAGIAGALYAVWNFIITTSSLHWLTSAEPVLMTLLGGPTSFVGPILGAIMFVGLEETLTRFISHWHFWLGVILLAIIMFFPAGVAGIIKGEESPIERARALLDRGQSDQTDQMTEES